MDDGIGYTFVSVFSFGLSSFRHAWKSQPLSHLHQLSEGVGLHLVHHFAAVCLHRDLAYAEFPADLFIQRTGNHQLYNLTLTMIDRIKKVPYPPYFCLATNNDLAALDGVSDGTQQCVIAKWLRQELDSASLHCLDGHWYVTVTRNEDDRHIDPIAGHAFLQIEPIETWKRNVKYEAARNKDSWAAEKLLCGCECVRLPALAENQQLQRLAYGDVVVNHEYDWSAVRHGGAPLHD